MSYSITKNGKELPKSKYTIDEVNKTFSSKEDNLVLDFAGLSGWTFNTGSGWTFNTSWNCVLNTGYDCTFKTDDSSFIITEPGTYEIKKGKLIKK